MRYWFNKAGGCRAQWKLHPTKLSTCAGSRVWSTLCTCYSTFNLFSYGTGLSREPQPESIYCFPSSWPRAKPRTLLRLFIYLGFLDQFPKIVSTLHGFHNLFIGFFLRDSDWDLINLAMIFNVWDLFEGVPGHDCLFGVPPIIRIILLRLLFFQSNLHVRGFSSQRIT